MGDWAKDTLPGRAVGLSINNANGHRIVRVQAYTKAVSYGYGLYVRRRRGRTEDGVGSISCPKTDLS